MPPNSIHVFTNRDLRNKLPASVLPPDADEKRQSARVSRLLHQLHAYRLIAKIPRSASAALRCFACSTKRGLKRL
jgi:hypothetical protein